MDVEEATREIGRLYPALYSCLYRRRDPRALRPSPESLAVMEHLAATGPLTVTEAARHFDRSQAAVSELIERLLRRGLLDRIPDERDRRRHLVWLTQQGRELLESERSVLSPALLTRGLRRMSERDRNDLVRGMRALLQACLAGRYDRRDHGAEGDDHE